MSAATPRYQQIVDELSAEIHQGRAKAGQKLPSEAVLVKKFATSRITVGRALRELQNAGLIERRAGSGTFVAEAARPATTPLTFGLLIPDLGETDIFDPICHGIASAPETADHALLWGHNDVRSAGKVDQSWKLCQQFIARQVAGVFFAPLEFEMQADSTNRKILSALYAAEVPVVLLDRRPSSTPQRMRADVVSLNHRRAGYLATEHLIRLGCKRIGFMAHQAAASTVSARVSGYYDALRDHGLSDRFSPLAQLPEVETPATGSEQVEAFVCINDRIAGVLMHAFLAKGVRIPADIRLVGIDDVGYASLLPVPLTTVNQPCGDIGFAAMRAMLERVGRPELPSREILFEGELVIRRSCGS